MEDGPFKESNKALRHSLQLKKLDQFLFIDFFILFKFVPATAAHSFLQNYLVVLQIQFNNFERKAVLAVR